MIKRLTILLVTVCFNSGISFAQDSNTIQNWFDYTQKNKINGNWSYLGDYSFRFQIENQDSKWWKFHARPSVIFKNKVLYDLRAGIMFSYAFNTAGNNIEIRPWQGIRVNWPNFSRFRLYQYGRMEERFSKDIESDVNNFILKLRYKLGMNIPINNQVITSKTFYGLIGYELFFNIGGGNQEFIDDRTRFNIGVGYRFNEKTDLRLQYIFQKSRVNLEESNNSNDNIIRISVVQYFGFE